MPLPRRPKISESGFGPFLNATSEAIISPLFLTMPAGTCDEGEVGVAVALELGSGVGVSGGVVGTTVGTTVGTDVGGSVIYTGVTLGLGIFPAGTAHDADSDINANINAIKIFLTVSSFIRTSKTISI